MFNLFALFAFLLLFGLTIVNCQCTRSTNNEIQEDVTVEVEDTVQEDVKFEEQNTYILVRPPPPYDTMFKDR